MITRVGMAPRAIGLTYEGFQQHWRSEHAGVAGQLSGLRGYVQNHAILDDGRPLLPYPGFDACSEIQFETLDSMEAAFASEHYQTAVTDDEYSLIDKTRFAMFLSERHVLLDGELPADAVKLLTFFPVDPRSTAGALRDVLAGEYREIVSEAGPLRHEQLMEIPGAHEGRLPTIFNAVDLLWFGSVEQALEFVRGDVGHRVGYAVAGAAFGIERILARTVRVV